MKTKVKAVTSFMHGRIHMQPGDEMEVTKGDADELQNAGLVQLVNEQEAAPKPAEAPAETPASDDVTDILGGDEPEGQKMDDEPQNKMEPEPENKSEETKPARKQHSKKAS